MRMKINIVLLVAVGCLMVVACGPDEVSKPEAPSPNGCQYTVTNIENYPYSPQEYVFTPPNGNYPTMPQPTDNKATVAGIELGRYLFYERKLSGNNTMNCASCHQIEKAFTDGLATSKGIDNINGKRSSMSLINVGFAQQAGRNYVYMWDGRFKTLEQQALTPIEDVLEMHANWADVECKLRNSTLYHRLFRAAFGIKTNKEITRDLAAKALAQFVRSLVSFNSRYDGNKLRNRQPGVDYSFTDDETEGYKIFFNDQLTSALDFTLPAAECNHCHDSQLFSNGTFSNNGLDESQNLENFTDNGYGAITGIKIDNGKFKVPTLRNIALTAPYMHDGRFNTLQEVLDHYVDHLKYAPNLDANLTNPPTSGISRGLRTLTTAEKTKIVLFLNTLTDSSYFNKPEWKSPF